MSRVPMEEAMPSEIVAGLLVLVGVLAAGRGVRALGRGLREARPLDVVRGIRGCVIALATAAFAAGILLAQTGLLVLGAVFLAEELYETGVLALIIRSGARTESEGSRGLSARDYE
jgi:hypothetical protein